MLPVTAVSRWKITFSRVPSSSKGWGAAFLRARVPLVRRARARAAGETRARSHAVQPAHFPLLVPCRALSYAFIVDDTITSKRTSASRVLLKAAFKILLTVYCLLIDSAGVLLPFIVITFTLFTVNDKSLIRTAFSSIS